MPHWTESARRQYARTATRYTTDLTDTEFALIAPHLPAPSRLGRPRKVDLREVLNAILYLLRTSCPWGLLPKELPPKSTVFGYFRRWWEDGTLPAYTTPSWSWRRASGRPGGAPTAGIVDSQWVQTTESGGPSGYDAGKKINGRKRHILVDTLGLLLRGVIHTANIQDRDGLPRCSRRLRRRFPWLAPDLRRWRLSRRDRCRRSTHERLRLTDRQALRARPRGFAVLPKRWLVERTFAWLGRNRRLAKDAETLIASSTAMLYLAAIHLLTRSLANLQNTTFSDGL